MTVITNFFCSALIDLVAKIYGVPHLFTAVLEYITILVDLGPQLKIII